MVRLWEQRAGTRFLSREATDYCTVNRDSLSRSPVWCRLRCACEACSATTPEGRRSHINNAESVFGTWQALKPRSLKHESPKS